MVTVLRIDGFRVVIFVNDHRPAHVHVIAADGQAKINLARVTGDPELVWAEGLSRADLRRALRIVANHRALLLNRWSEIHG